MQWVRHTAGEERSTKAIYGNAGFVMSVAADEMKYATEEKRREDKLAEI